MLIRSVLIKNPSTGYGFTIPITENLKDWFEQDKLYVSDGQVIDIQGLDPGVSEVSFSKQSISYVNSISNFRYPVRTLEFTVLAPNGNVDILRNELGKVCSRGTDVDVYFASIGTSAYFISGVIESIQYSKFSSERKFSFSVVCAEYPFFKETSTLDGYPRGTKSFRKLDWSSIPESEPLELNPTGNRPAGFRMEISLGDQLPATGSISVSDNYTHKRLTIQGPIARGAKLRIDTGYKERSVKVNSASSPQLIKVTYDSGWPLLPPPDAFGKSYINLNTQMYILNSSVSVSWTDEVDGL